MTDALGIFAKWPEPDRVKTRLAAATSPEFAAQVADAFLRDTLDRLASVEAERWLVFAPPTREPEFQSLAAGRFQPAPQGDGDLGVRMERFIRERLDNGTQRIVIVGTDSPTLAPELVSDALRMLRDADMVIGPATDGGYYLIGCRRRIPPVFDEIEWGTPTVLRDTFRRIDGLWRIAILPPWYDVDTLDDWQFLQGHVAALRRAGIDPRCPRTERLLDESPPLRP